MSGSIPIGAMLIVWSSVSLAQEGPLIEEVIVSAQRVEENAQKVPIALSAFTDAMIQDRQIIGLTDLQINAPNVSFAGLLNGEWDMRIRGVGQVGALGGVERSVSTHINEIALPQSFFAAEFYDLERIELMRGPQGTLFGRNATAGALNQITKKPRFDGIEGYIDVEYGDFDHTRLKGAFNFPVSDRLAFRVAAMDLKRDGYTENKADGQVPGVDSDVDGRNITAWRITGAWRISDRMNLWVMHDRFDEDDDKTTRTNVVCKQSDLPVAGCDADAFGLETPHPGAAWWSIAAGFAGAIPLGAVGNDDGLTYDFPRPELGLREVHTDLEPEWRLLEKIWALGFDWTSDRFALTVTSGYLESKRKLRRDPSMDVGFNLNPTPQNPSGLYPTSAPSGGIGAYRDGNRCNANDYQAGIYGGCVAPVDQTRGFAYVNLDRYDEHWVVEAKFRTIFEGSVNLLLGAEHQRNRGRGDIYNFNNMMDLVSTQVASGAGVRLYPGFILSTWNETDWKESYAAFGELYWEPTERLKVTTGLRYNWDHRPAPNVEFLGPGTAFDINSAGVLGPEPQWVRTTLVPWVIFGQRTPDAIALADLYGATKAISDALPRDLSDPAGFAELVDALQLVPPLPDYGETLAITGVELKNRWEEISGRIAVDWLVAPNSLFYASYTRGFKPGGISTSRAEFDREVVNALEIGAKTTLLQGSLQLNTSVFVYDYTDLQIEAGFVAIDSKNADANIKGAELEALWRPVRIPNLTVQMSYGWLDTELEDFEDVDPVNPTANDDNWVRLKNPAGNSYVAPVADVLPLVDAAIGALFPQAFPAPGTVYDNGIPAYFNQSFLAANGVTTLAGLPTDLDGNALPNSPEHSARISLAYSWYLTAGTLTARWDYYWQDKSYARRFNTAGDRIDSWDQHNASLIFESANNKWSGRLWVRNIEDEDIVTSHNVEPDPFGQSRGYFLTEPRIFGLSVRYDFGID